MDLNYLRRLAAVAWLVLIGFATFSTAVFAAQPWPTTQFEIHYGNPYVDQNLVLDAIGYDVVEFQDLFALALNDQEDTQEIEAAFATAAKWYAERNFPPPKIEPLVGEPDHPKYRIYVCSQRLLHKLWDYFVLSPYVLQGSSVAQYPFSSCEAAGAHLGNCAATAELRNVLYMNDERGFTSDGKLNAVGYQTIAHELFHAIQAGSRMGNADNVCSIGGWITEGLADAVAHKIYFDKWSDRGSLGTSDYALWKVYGYRPYVFRLPQGDAAILALGSSYQPGDGVRADYGTSSFWRYLADAYGRGEDYGYLTTPDEPSGAAPGLMDIPMGSGSDWKREVQWLDKGLRGKFNQGLDQLYGLFVANFAYRMPPYTRFANKPAPDNLEVWVSEVFSTCSDVNISTANPNQTIAINVQPLASTCIWLHPTDVSGLIQVSFQAESDSLQELQDIVISRSGTALLSRAFPIAETPNGPKQWLTSWRDYPNEGSQKQLFLVSNVSKLPDQTKPRSYELTVSMPGNGNNLRGAFMGPIQVAPGPQQPSYDRNAKTLAAQKADTQAMVSRQMQLDMESLNANVSGATEINRQEQEHACSEPFVYTACGPRLGLSLDLMPGTFARMGQTSASGGIAAQAFGALQAMAASSMMNTQDAMQKLEARLDQIDGSHVMIEIPLVDYGFSGGIGNAEIRVRMSGGRTMRAIGPPDSQGRSRLIGNVTIEEYTPFYIRGRFSGSLAHFPIAADGTAVFTSGPTIQGTFNSVAPWQEDSRMSMVQIDDFDEIADEVGNTLGIPANILYRMKQQGQIPGAGSSAPASGGGSSGGVLSGPDCSCECANQNTASELCEFFCEEEFAACP